MKLKIVLSFFGVAKAGKIQTKKICTNDLQIAAGSSTSLNHLTKFTTPIDNDTYVFLIAPTWFSILASILRYSG
jgi:hypothetical protein